MCYNSYNHIYLFRLSISMILPPDVIDKFKKDSMSYPYRCQHCMACLSGVWAFLSRPVCLCVTLLITINVICLKHGRQDYMNGSACRASTIIYRLSIYAKQCLHVKQKPYFCASSEDVSFNVYSGWYSTEIMIYVFYICVLFERAMAAWVFLCMLSNISF